MAAEIADRIELLKSNVKTYLAAQGQEKLFIGAYKVTYTKYITTRFDSKTFKAEHSNMYEQYAKQTEATRLTIS